MVDLGSTPNSTLYSLYNLGKYFTSLCLNFCTCNMGITECASWVFFDGEACQCLGNAKKVLAITDH